jgi:SAM-dependent methyltransferase
METVDLARLALAPGERLLDVGCGRGHHAVSAYARADVDVVALDLDRRGLAAAHARLVQVRPRSSCRKSFALLQADALRLPFADGSFDKVICAELLEHLPDYEAALREVARVLRPGGLFAASVPSFVPEWVCRRLSRGYRESPGGHVRIFRAARLRRAIEAHGLVHVCRHRAHALHSPYWWLKCLYWERESPPAIVDWYHRLLVWNRMRRPLVTQLVEKALNPLLGKSVVMYFVKEGGA